MNHDLLTDAEAIVIWLRHHDLSELDDSAAAFVAQTVERLAAALQGTLATA